MPVLRKVWDLKADGGPTQIEMYSLGAKEAVKNDPERYAFELPEPKVERPKGKGSEKET